MNVIGALLDPHTGWPFDLPRQKPFRIGDQVYIKTMAAEGKIDHFVALSQYPTWHMVAKVYVQGIIGLTDIDIGDMEFRRHCWELE